MIEADIVAILRADAAVTALAGDRITPGYLVYEGTFPAIAVRRTSGSPNYTFSGAGSESTVLLLIAWGPGWAAARQLAEAARACLRKYSGGTIEIISVADGEDIPVPETNEYGCTLIVTVDHEEE